MTSIEVKSTETPLQRPPLQKPLFMFQLVYPTRLVEYKTVYPFFEQNFHKYLVLGGKADIWKSD